MGPGASAFDGNLNPGLAKKHCTARSQAGLASRQKPGLWRHPYFWAAFALVGKGK
jgi:CHAT domain-containing protein